MYARSVKEGETVWQREAKGVWCRSRRRFGSLNILENAGVPLWAVGIWCTGMASSVVSRSAQGKG